MRKIALFLIVAMAATIAYGKQNYDRKTPVVEAFDLNKNAVVNIASKQVVRVQDPIWRGMPFGVRKREIPSLGSGFIIDRRGYIITNAHVVENADDITIIMADRVSKYQARKVAVDRVIDLAVLKIDADKDLPTVTLGRSSDLMIGETILAIGNPFGYNHTLTDGIVSAIHEDLVMDDGRTVNMIQISAPINPGNSGGPLININGELVGINTAIRESAEGIGFAIPIDVLRDKLPDMINVEKLRRMDFGLQVKDDFQNEDNSGNSIKVNGLKVISVRPGSYAESAGFAQGDVITAINNKPAECAVGFYFDILESQYGGNLNFKVKPDKSSGLKNIAMVIKERPKPDASELTEKLFGLKVKPLTKQMATQYGIYGELGQPVVVSVERNSPADIAGIEPKDILIGIDEEGIRSIDELANKIELTSHDAMTKVTITRSVKKGWNTIVSQYQTTLKTKSMDGAVDKKYDL